MLGERYRVAENVVHPCQVRGASVLCWNGVSRGFIGSSPRRIFVTFADMLVDEAEIAEGTEIEGMHTTSADIESHDTVTDDLMPSTPGPWMAQPT